MITFIQARVPRSSISISINKKHIFATLACVQTFPLPQKLCDLRLYKRTLYESFKQGGWAGEGGGGVSKEICGTVRLPV